MKKLFILMQIFLLLTFMTNVAFSGAASEKKDETLVVGMELQFPPFETTDVNGNPSGFSVDFATELAKALGREVEIKNIAWSGLIPAVQTGSVDIVISSMSETEERKKSVDFTVPYGTWYIVSLLNRDLTIQNFAELNDAQYSVAVKIGTVAETIAAEKLPNAKAQKFDSWDTIVLEVAQGRAHAAIYDPISVYNAHQKYPETTKPLFEPISGFSSPVAGAMKKGNDELREKINAFITQAKKDGTIARISKKYLGDMNVIIKEQGAPPFFE